MEEFTASNGVSFKTSCGVAMYVTTRAGVQHHLGDDVRQAFRELEDRELGRWRWSENPEFVVYPTDFDGMPCAHVVNENTGWLSIVYPHYQANEGDRPLSAGLAYFELINPKRPWRDAKLGEVWAVKKQGNPEELAAQVGSLSNNHEPEQLFFIPIRGGECARVDDWKVCGARRIWPEQVKV